MCPLGRQDFQGRFGRVALLGMKPSLVGHAHHYCHILDDTVVLVNAWEPHACTHDTTPGEKTLILAL